MDPKKILFVDLERQTSEMRFIPELTPYLGGVAMGVKLYSLYKEFDPIVISIGPLNGFFPFASKTCVISQNNGVIEDLYIGGALGSRIRYSGLDAIVIASFGARECVLDIVNDEVNFLPADTNFNSLGLPGKKSILKMEKGLVTLDGYFSLEAGILEAKFATKKFVGFSLTGSRVFNLPKPEKYSTLFSEILSLKESLSVASDGKPSCSGCPIGCVESRIGEIGGNILVHSLVSCSFAENVYSNLGTVFACLDCLGLKYTHEQLETLPDLFSKTLREIS